MSALVAGGVVAGTLTACAISALFDRSERAVRQSRIDEGREPGACSCPQHDAGGSCEGGAA